MHFDFKIILKFDKFNLNQQFKSDESVVGLFGHSGSGKTSILNAIAGLRTPQQGWIKVNQDTWFDHEKKNQCPDSKTPCRFGLSRCPIIPT